MTGSTATGSHSFYQYEGGTPQWVPTLCNQGYGPRGHSPLYRTGSLAATYAPPSWVSFRADYRQWPLRYPPIGSYAPRTRLGAFRPENA